MPSRSRELAWSELRPRRRSQCVVMVVPGSLGRWGLRLELSLAFGLGQEASSSQAERLRDLLDVVERDVRFASLNRSHIRAVDLASVCE